MDAYKTEDEQVEAFKKWWKENGTALVVGIIIVLLAAGGYRYWTAQKHSDAVQASALLDSAVEALANGDDQRVSDAAGQLLSAYSDTAYAPLAALTLAKSKHAVNDLTSAQTYLEWALDNTKDDAVKHIARVRLVSVLWDQDKAADALQLMDGVAPGEFMAIYEELRGDIYASQGENEKAIEAYELAVGGSAFGDTGSVQLKLDGLKSASAK